MVTLGPKQLMTVSTVLLAMSSAGLITGRVFLQVIERMYFKVREGVLAGDVETRYINTKQNPSDLFTKDVPREVVEVLGPMLTGEAAWPDTPESEDALKAQIADMRLCV